MTEAQSATYGESPDEWYEREKTAFRAWWESEGEKTFSRTTTLAAGAGWFARAEAAPETAPIVPCLATNGCATPEWCARNGDACRVKTPVSERGLRPAEGHCLLQVPQQTPENPSPCAMAGHCIGVLPSAPSATRQSDEDGKRFRFLAAGGGYHHGILTTVQVDEKTAIALTPMQNAYRGVCLKTAVDKAIKESGYAE